MVISIIGVLVGLLLPAIGAAREAGRRAQCQSNLHNITLGILGYVNNQNVFPPAGEFCEDATTLTQLTTPGNVPDPTQSVILTYLPGSTATIRGVPMYSWVVPILPYLDNQELYNQWTMFSQTSANVPFAVAYFDPTNYVAGQSSNQTIGNNALGILKCPDDNTVQVNQGNLSYAVNGGFSLWHAVPYGWVGSQIDGGGSIHAETAYLEMPTAIGYTGTVAVTQKLGVMFLESSFPQGVQTRIPWNVRSSLTSMVDGASATIMISENTLTGVSSPNPYTANLEGNWAAPMPSLSMFMGPSNVCGVPNTLDCTAGQLAPASVSSGAGTVSGDADGPGWAYANKVGTFENINGGQNLTIEGSYPFSNSAHPAGANMGFCDGAVRFIRNQIDGTVYSKIITPAGSKLPLYCKQMPVAQDAFAN